MLSFPLSGYALLRAASSAPRVCAVSSRLLHRSTLLCEGHWDKDYKPGPFPKTPEERKKAAEKYNLPEKLYEPYPDDGMGKGDYPKVKSLSGDARDPFYPWDYPDSKRNFNEPIPYEDFMYNQNRYDKDFKPPFPRWVIVTVFFSVIGSIITVYWIMDSYKVFQPALAKQYPREGPHYLFPGDHQPGSKIPHH